VLGRLNLRESLALDGVADVTGKLGLCQHFFRLGNFQIGKDVAAALRHRNSG
jgi:hypothetical protein